MWFIGAVIGAILGGLAGGAELAYVFGLIGALGAAIISSSRKKKKNPAWRSDTNPGTAQATPQNQQFGKSATATPDLNARVQKLEQRLSQLERELAVLRGQAGVPAPEAAHAEVEKSVVSAVKNASQTASATQPDQPNDVSLAKATQKLSDTKQLPQVAHTQLASEPVKAKAEPALSAQPATQALQVDTSKLSTAVTSVQPANVDEASAATNSSALPQSQSVNQTTHQPESQPVLKPGIAAKAKPVAKKEFNWREDLPAPIANFIFGGNWLVKSGLAILFLGLAFLLRYTSDYFTVPTELRYAGVAAAALSSIVLGWRLRLKNPNFGLSLQGLGIGSFYLTALFALKLHHLIDHLPCFAFLFLLSVLAAALAVLQKAPVLAVVASLAGFATPVLSGSGENNPHGLFTYLAILDLGICIIAWFQAWRYLNLIGFVGTFALAAGWAERYYSDPYYLTSQSYLILFGLMYALIGLFYAKNTLREAIASESLRNSVKRVGRIDSALVFGLPITAFAIQYVLVKSYELGSALAAVGYALFYLVLARVVYARASYGLRLLAEAYLIIAGIFVTLAIPLALENTWTGAAWAIEGAGMYWLGVRQQRPYARGLAYLVLAGAWSKLSFAMSFNQFASETVLQGSWLGALILLLSCLVIWALFPATLIAATLAATTSEAGVKKFDFNLWFASIEHNLRQAALWLATIALVSLFWLCLSSRWAALAQAVSGACLIYLAGRRLKLADFLPRGVALQVLAVVQFALSLHRNPEAGAYLDSGWQGMLVAGLIALAILSNIVLAIRAQRRASLQSGQTLVWSKSFNLGLLVASLMLQGCLLFACDLNQAAIIWSLTAALFIALAIYLANYILALGSGLVMLVSLVIYALGNRSYPELAPLIWNQQFAAPFSLAVGLLFIAERIYQAAKRGPWTWPLKCINAWRLHNGWCHTSGIQVLPLLAGLWFWFTAWNVEASRFIQLRQLDHFWAGSQLGLAFLSAGLLYWLARKRDWQWASYAQFMYLPWMIWVAHSLRLQALYREQIWIPMQGWDYLIWAGIFIAHLSLLKRAQPRLTITNPFLLAMHALSCWFFVSLLVVQSHGVVAQLSLQENAWTAMAWLAPALFSILLILQQRQPKAWPWRELRDFYQQIVAWPIAMFSLCWFFYTTLTHDGNSQPLPFISLLNPLELGQLACVATLLIWWRVLPQGWRNQAIQLKFHYGLAATGLLWYTSLVLRACSHYADIPYFFDDLYQAKLAQAAISVAWAAAAVVSMILANRRSYRSLWLGGAALLAVVILKLFVVELADHGGLYRIISFIVVGLLLLIVGYFAPMPGMKKTEAET